MAKKKLDFGLILSLGLIIAVGGYWFVKELPVEGIEYYIDILGEKLVSLVPKEKEKQEVAQIYSEFREKVKEKKIKPEEVEQFAAAVINLSNTNDTLSFAEAQQLIEAALSDIPIVPEIHESTGSVEPKPEEWESLSKRLSTVHQLDEHLKAQQAQKAEPPVLAYRVDENLNVIIDSKVRPELEKEDMLRKLEEEDRLIWMDNMEEHLNKSLERLEMRLQALSKNKAIKESVIKAKVLTPPQIEKYVDILDSLNLGSIIPWDSIEAEVRHDLEEKRKEIKRAKAAVQSKQKVHENSH